MIIAEGSGTPVVDGELRRLAEEHGKEIVEAVYDLTAVTRRYGKGRAEAMLIDAVVPMLSEGVFYKATGGPFVVNIGATNDQRPVTSS